MLSLWQRLRNARRLRRVARPSAKLHVENLERREVAAIANVTSHELSEAITDPRGSGWYDSGGAEDGDKCAWTFTSLEKVGGQTWKLQQEWSNNAYTAGRGSPVGCLP